MNVGEPGVRGGGLEQGGTGEGLKTVMMGMTPGILLTLCGAKKKSFQR